MMRGAVPAASEVTFPKSELFNAETGLFGVIVLKTLKTSHRNCIVLAAEPERSRQPRVDVPPPGTEDGVNRHRPVGAGRGLPGTRRDSATARSSDSA